MEITNIMPLNSLKRDHDVVYDQQADTFTVYDRRHGLLINNPAKTPVDITAAVILTKVVERIRTAIGVHILLPVATDTPGDIPRRLLCYKRIINLCPLYVGYSNGVQERRTRLTDKEKASPMALVINDRSGTCGGAASQRFLYLLKFATLQFYGNLPC